MRFVGTEDERVTGRNVGLAVLVANTAFSGNDQIQFPLSRVRVVREIAFSWWDPAPFQIERMALRQIERRRLAPQCFRNSFEKHGVFSAWRLPGLFFDVVKIYFEHTKKL